MSAGLTWARNEFDDQALSMKDLVDGFLKIKTQHEAQFSKPLKAVRLSRETLMCIPLAYRQPENPVSTFYGVPVEIDDSLALWEFKGVYAENRVKANDTQTHN